MAKTSLYVGNLPHNFNQADLVKVFAPYGCTVARVIQGKNFGFVDVDSENAEKAIQEKNEFEVGDKNLSVSQARSANNSN